MKMKKVFGNIYLTGNMAASLPAPFSLPDILLFKMRIREPSDIFLETYRAVVKPVTMYSKYWA